jgi:tRNA-specific 2-thiouridylase
MPRSAKKRVLVGMSGGVDSGVAAALLLEEGYEVIGGFIKNWSDSKDLWTGECSWKEERRDAVRVAAKIGIPLLTFDFEEAYRRQVVDELFHGYQAGVTPNPDVLCNEAIKFGLFFEAAKSRGFDAIATGHYARLRFKGTGEAELLRGRDADKDQSYFLYRVPQSALRRTLFPVGNLKKLEVRSLAKKFGLPVAYKPDSQGICFIGKLDMGEFLRRKIPSQPGNIETPEGEVLGRHEGLDRYTIGQRQAIKVSAGGHAWYVADKDLERRTLIVVPSDDHPLMFKKSAKIADVRWISGAAPKMPFTAEVQIRYRQPSVPAEIANGKRSGDLIVTFHKPQKAVAPGQSAVIYRGEICLGGGILLEGTRVG